MTLFTSNSDESSNPVKRKMRGWWRVPGSMRRNGMWQRFGWGLVIAFVLLGVADYAVFRDAYMYDYGDEAGARGGPIGQWAHIDRAFKAVDPAGIEYAVFGDSQSIDALRPDAMAAELGVDATAIFNFSVTGGKPSDNLYTYRTYIGRMPNLKRVLYVVNEHQLNNADVGSDLKFKFHARLGDRLRAMDTDNYGELLTGWALRSFGLRGEWTKLVERYRQGKWPAHPAVYPGGIEPTVWSKPADYTPEYAREVADRWFKDWEPDGVHTEVFERLIGDMRSRGLEVVVLQIPRTAWFEDVIASDYAAEQAQYVERVSAAVELAGAAFVIVDPADAGMTLEDFRDANHLNEAGAGKISRYAAGRWWR